MLTDKEEATLDRLMAAEYALPKRERSLLRKLLTKRKTLAEQGRFTRLAFVAFVQGGY